MPHSTLPYVGFQAVILCGPGASFDTFTSNPKEFPKALLPIANRPMIWYPLDWCYRMGVSNITLVTPPESSDAIQAALDQNPFLTGLPTPKPEVLAPADLTQTTGTGEIFKLPEVIRAIKSDFIVLPCDLVSEVDGATFLQTWMTLEGGLGGAGSPEGEGLRPQISSGGESIGRRGGLSVWYPTKGIEGVTTKSEQTDYIATVPLPESHPPPPEGSLRANVSSLVLSIPRSTVKDIMEDNGALPIRHSLLKRHGRVDMKTSYRDAHIYFLPYWTLEMMQRNDFDSVAEDVIGWWAKSTWQDGLGDKLGLRDVLRQRKNESSDDLATSQTIEDEVDLAALSTTSTAKGIEKEVQGASKAASRVPGALSEALNREALIVPPILAYVQPSHATVPDQALIRRVDTSSLLLSMSLRLAKIASTTESEAQGITASPFAHKLKVAHPDMVQTQSRVFEPDSLVAANVAIASRVNIKESVIGFNCTIGTGSRITKCLLMEGVVIGENVTLQGCIIGRRSKIEGGPDKDDGTKLVDCEVQHGFVVEAGTEAKNEKFMAFEGLDAADSDMELDSGEDADI